MFTLSAKAINSIKDTPGIKLKLALALKLSENSINRLVAANEPNGDLTKEVSLLVIQKVTKLSRKEILVGQLVTQT